MRELSKTSLPLDRHKKIDGKTYHHANSTTSKPVTDGTLTQRLIYNARPLKSIGVREGLLYASSMSGDQYSLST